MENVIASTQGSFLNQTDSTDYAEACYSAITTLAFVAPDAVLPRIMERLRADLSSDISSLTDLDIGIWNTPEGQTFVDGEFPRGLSKPMVSL